MTRLNILLLLAVIASALYLVQVSYEVRRQFISLEREHDLARQIDQESEKLRVNLQTQATHLRVEQMANERLQMVVANPSVIQYLNDGRPVAASAPAPVAAASAAARAARKPRTHP